MTALLQQVKDYEEAARNQTGLSFFTSLKYGIAPFQDAPSPIAIVNLRSKLEGAQADLAQCRLNHGLEEFGTVGKFAAKVTDSLYKWVTS